MVYRETSVPRLVVWSLGDLDEQTMSSMETGRQD
jgi:hypothetical protein